MSKLYDHQSPHSDHELIRKIGVIGNLWHPSMSKNQIESLYAESMEPKDDYSTLNLLLSMEYTILEGTVIPLSELEN